MIGQQTTIARSVSIRGTGLHTGNRVEMSFHPAGPDHGIVFRRVDQDPPLDIPARVDSVPEKSEFGRNTTLERDGVRIHTVEHVLAAVTGLGIDNLRIDIDSNEPVEPDDGSAGAFVDLLRATGTSRQGTPKRTYVVRRPVSVRNGDAELHALPHDGFRVSFTIRYDNPVIGTQHASFEIDPEVFAREIAPARTFALMRDVRELQARGLIKGGSLANAVVVDEDRILNDGPLRFPDEFVRHKILDLLGDLSLLGRPIQGHVLSIRSGHDSNVQFVRRLAEANDGARAGIARPGIVLDIQAIQRIMPHRYPLLLVDRILEFEDRKRVVGIKNVTINEPFFIGHFPGHPIMPAVLIIEAMAQCGGVLLLNSVDDPENKLMYFVGIDKARFRKPVTPGDQLRFELQLIRFGGSVCKMEGKAFVDGDLVAEAELLSTVIEKVSMLDIHVTAVVHPKAQLGRDVVVGPYSVVGPDVVIGDETWIGAHAVLEGRTTIGKANRIFHGAVLGAVPQDLKYRDEATYLRIGDRNTIREYATLHLACIEGEATVVGDGCLLMAYVHVAHNCRVGSNVILANAVNLAGHVEVQDYASIGGVTPVHQFVRIGAYAFVGGGSRVPKDVPPFVKAAGNPLELAGINSVGLERRGFDADRRTLLKRAYRVLFRSGLNITQGLEALRRDFDPSDEDLQTLIRFVEKSERGIHT